MESLSQSYENTSLLRSQTPADENNSQVLDKEMREFLTKMDNWSQNCQDLDNNLRDFADPEAHENSILIVGDTDAGKSTLAHALVGVSLECFIHPEKRIKVIDCVNIEDRERMRIGHTQNSETKIPYRVRGPNNLILYDCCGFKDTEGAGDEIQNLLYIKALAAKLKRAKIILTISEPDILKKQGILKQFEHMMKMFCNQELLKSSLYLVITKGTEWTTKENIVDIETNLRGITVDQPNQNQSIEEIINTLVEKKRIGLFPKPSALGPVDQAIFQDILTHVDQVPEFDIGMVNIEISAEAKDFLKRTLIKLNECVVVNQLREISKKVISQLCNEKIDIAQDLTQVHRFCGRILNEIIPEPAFSAPDRSKHDILSEVINFADKIINISNTNDIINDCDTLKKYASYMKELLEICPENSLDCVKWNTEAENLRKAIQDIKKVSEKIDGNTMIFRGIVMSAYDIRKGIEEKRLQNLKRVEVYCQNTLFLDENLVLPGVDLLIISPTWVMYTPTKIDLSGEEQKELPQISENQDGEPGLPGRNSGNFVGICMKFMGRRFQEFQLILEGGNGGQGLNGKNGRPGDAGADGDLDKIKSRDEENRKSKEILYRPTSMAYSMLTWNATFSEVYRSEGESGKRGEDGGRGGSGGLGGKGGQAYFMKGEEVVRLSEESLKTGDGEQGKPGEGGDGGPGGNGGKTYEARYFNDRVLPELRDKDYWRSKRTPKKILNGPRTVSRGIMHAGMIATKVTFPVFLPAIALFQFGMSWHLANINSHWKKQPEDCFTYENEGEQGQTPEDKNSHGLIDPLPNNFDINYEKAILSQNYMKDYSDIPLEDPLKCLKKPMHLIH